MYMTSKNYKIIVVSNIKNIIKISPSKRQKNELGRHCIIEEAPNRIVSLG